MNLINQFLLEEAYTKDDIGCSDSKVLIGSDAVLKIQTNTIEAQNEYLMMKWLEGKINVPDVLEMEVRDNQQYLLMTKIKGDMACDRKWLNDYQSLLPLFKKGLEKLWSIDISDCPCLINLDKKLEIAYQNIINNHVDIENSQPDTYGPDGFKDPMDLYQWLVCHKPEEELVLTHGDCCLPNLFICDGKLDGFIDIGRMAISDKWQDISLLYRSLRSNFDGSFGYKDESFNPEMLFDILEIEKDEEKLKYYILLDELF